MSEAGITATDLLNDPDLATVLLHHVVSGTVLSTDLSNGEVTTLSGLDVTVDVSSGAMIDSSNVTLADIIADNGAVHVIDYVLLPTYDDVTEVVSTSANHTTLLAALSQANLVGTLQDPNAEFTVFAPTDSAFNWFLSEAGITATDLLNDPDLATVLLHHVVSGTVLSTDLSNGEVTTLSGLDVTVDVSSGAMIDSSNVTLADIIADNGAVHVIDYVLLPTYDDVTEVVVTSPNHTILLAALQQANLVGTLQDMSQEFTVFAPTDSAFNTYLTAEGITASDLLASPNLSNILLHHVVSGTVLSTDLTNGDVPTLNMTNVTIDLTSGVMVDNANVTAADIVADNGVVHVIDGVLIPSTVTSVEELNNNASVYPNPFTSELRVDLDGAYAAKITDLTGRVVLNTSLNNGIIELGNLSKGTYILNIETVGLVRKIMKKIRSDHDLEKGKHCFPFFNI